MDMEYFKALLARVSEAQQAPFREVRFRNGDRPQRSNCHDNAKRWVIENPDFRVVLGWLLVDGEGLLLDRHSVVEGPDGKSMDITPMSVSLRPRFLRHEGDVEQYERVAPDQHQVNLIGLTVEARQSVSDAYE
jgi:hypothetical protein